MKIKELLIQRYGPISKFEFKNRSDFTLFFGKNESGKTLTIDAMVKFLLNKKGDRKIFDKLDRVDEEPSGYLIMQDSSGMEFKLPEKGDMSSIFGFSASDARNIFVIRNADLTISEEEKIFGNVTERLTGMQTREIGKIKKMLQKFGRLTNPTADATLSNTQDADRAKSKVILGEDLIKRIQVLLAKSGEEGLNRIEEEISYKKEELKSEKIRLKNLDDARNREAYENTLKEYGNIESAMKILKDLGVFSADGLQIWRDSLRDTENTQRNLGGISEKLKNLQHEHDNKNAIYADNMRIFNGSDVIEKELNQKLRARLFQFEDMEKQGLFDGKKGLPVNLLMIITGIISVISVVLFAVFKPVYLLYFAFISFAALIGFGIFSVFQFVRSRAYRRLQSEILLESIRLGFNAKDVFDVIAVIGEFDRNYADTRDKVTQEQNRIIGLEKEIGILKGNYKIEEDKIRELSVRINDIKIKTGVDSFDKYLEKFTLKENLEKGMNKSLGILRLMHKSEGMQLEDEIVFWKEKLSELESYKDKGKGFIFNSKEYENCTLKIEALLSETEGLMKKLDDVGKNLNEIRIDAKEVIGEEDVYCNYLSDLENVKNRVQSVIDLYLHDMQKARHAISIFEEISADESQKIKDLFGEGSRVSEYFKYISGGDYLNVNFEPEENRIVVERGDGVRFKAGDLSQGTFDQLYLAIRLSLADTVLKEEPGFFIFDDPFLTSDEERLIKQLNVLQELATDGWQILYFTVKGEVLDKLSSSIKKGKVDRVDLSPIYAQA